MAKRFKFDLVKPGSYFEKPNIWPYLLLLVAVFSGISLDNTYYFSYLTRFLEDGNFYDTVLRLFQSVLTVGFMLWAIPSVMRKGYRSNWNLSHANQAAKSVFALLFLDAVTRPIFYVFKALGELGGSFNSTVLEIVFLGGIVARLVCFIVGLFLLYRIIALAVLAYKNLKVEKGSAELRAPATSCEINSVEKAIDGYRIEESASGIAIVTLLIFAICFSFFFWKESSYERVINVADSLSKESVLGHLERYNACEKLSTIREIILKAQQKGHASADVYAAIGKEVNSNYSENAWRFAHVDNKQILAQIESANSKLFSAIQNMPRVDWERVTIRVSVILLICYVMNFFYSAYKRSRAQRSDVEKKLLALAMSKDIDKEAVDKIVCLINSEIEKRPKEKDETSPVLGEIRALLEKIIQK